MQFHNFEENLLGSKVKMKLLKHLLKEGGISGEREIAKRINVSHSAVNKVVKDFYELNLIKPIRVGNVRIWQLNKESYAYKFLSKDLVSSLTSSPLEDLKRMILENVSYLPEVKKIIIFGSVTEGKEAPNSDIDLFILVPTERERENILPRVLDLNEKCIRVYGNKLSYHIFTNKDWINPKNKNFIKNVEKGIRIK